MISGFLKKPTYDITFDIVLFIFFLTGFGLLRQINGSYYMLAVLGIYALAQKKVRFHNLDKRTWRYIYFVLFLVALITISIYFYHPEVFFRYRYAVYRDLILLPLLFTAFYAADINFERALKIIVTAGLVTVIPVTIIFIEHTQRYELWLDPINRGNLGMLAGVICLTAAIYFNDTKWKIISIVGFLSGTMLSIQTGTRGGWFALIIVIITLLYQQYKSNKAAIKYILAACALLMLIIFIFWDILPLAPRIERTINSFQQYIDGDTKNTSLGIRLEMWRASWFALLDKPIFGWGWNNTGIYMAHFRELGLVDPIALPASRHLGHPHNQYFLFLGELGLLGFISFMTMIIFPLQHWIRGLFQANKLGDTNKAYQYLLPIVTYEAVLEFCLFDDALSQRSFMLLLIIITTLAFTLESKQSLKKPINDTEANSEQLP